MRFSAVVLLTIVLCGCVDSGKKTDAPVPKAPAVADKETAKYLNARQPGPKDPDAPEEFTTTDSGLKYRILRKADGNKPYIEDTVVCNYRGTLDDGTEFDSSYKKGESLSIPLRKVVPGWTEGLQLCPVGGMIELEIPGKLGYGPSGQGPIPPNATLHFIVELVEIR